MKNLKNNFVISTFIVLFAWGCATAEPHTFMSTYEPLPDKYFEDYENTETSIHTVSGSGFLRQVGGGIVNCAGNPVNAVPIMPTSSYEVERNGLSWSVRNATPLDSRYQADQARLKQISRSSYCDVDGKFEITGLTPGKYKVSTEISWVIPKVCGSGQYTYRCDAKQGGLRSAYLTVLNDPDKTLHKIIISQ
ncbi:hypothetical protein N9T51_02185 [Pseudomonadota bacterium]|jgi:hypothetical protein|nr:hypothetical protein [Pseudomonadota bacterium]